MSLAIVDGDYAECIRLARNGNWPLDWTAGDEDDDDVGEAPAPAPQTPEKDDAPAPPTYEPYVRGAADVAADATSNRSCCAPSSPCAAAAASTSAGRSSPSD